MDEFVQMTDDQLWSLLAERSGRDRIDVLWELGRRATDRRDMGRAMALLEEAEAAAAELPDQLLVVRAQHRQGVIAFTGGDPEEAAQRYARAADGFVAVGSTTDAAYALWGLADSLRVVGDHAGCLDAASQCRSLAEADDEIVLAGDACYQQARALYLLDREPEALVACTDGRDRYRSAGLADKVRQIDDFAVTVHLYLGQLDDALELAQGCLVLAGGSADDGDDPYQRLRLAEVHQQRGESSLALTHAERAKAQFRAMDDLQGVARCERLRADALYDLDQDQEAIDAYMEARVLFDATGRDTEALACDSRRAIVLHWIRDYESAARLNHRLVGQYSGVVDGLDDAQWSAVRLLDNLLRHEDFVGCMSMADEFRTLWPEDATAQTMTYREYLGFRAAALQELGHSEEAAGIASYVIRATPAREASASTALCYEIRGLARLGEDESAGAQDLAHAIALHLAKGNVSRARDLSRHFLPSDPGSGPSKTVTP